MSNVPSHSRTRRTHRTSLAAGAGSRRTHRESGYLPAISGASEVYADINEQMGGGEQITGGQIAPEAIFNPGQFAQTIRPVIVVEALPTLPDQSYPEGSTVVLTTDGKLYRNFGDSWTSSVLGLDGGIEAVAALPSLPDASYPQGVVVFLTTDDKLYRSTGSAWTAATDGSDITAGTITGDRLAAGTITAAEIAAGAIESDQLAADAVTAGKIAAGAVSTSELAVGARLTGEYANEAGGSPGVFMDSTGVLIRDGKLTLEDEFGLTTMEAAGFKGTWSDFLGMGLYNGSFAAGVLGALPLGRTASLPYWTVARDSSSTPPAYDNLGTGVVTLQTETSFPGDVCARMTWGAANDFAILFSDPVPVVPGAYYVVRMAAAFNRAAGDLELRSAVVWYDESGSEISTDVRVGVTSAGVFTQSVNASRVPSTYVFPAGTLSVDRIAPLSARSMALMIYGWESSHDSDNRIDVGGVSIARGAGFADVDPSATLEVEDLLVNGDQTLIGALTAGSVETAGDVVADRVDMQGVTSNTTFTISGGGTAAFGSKSLTWARLGPWVFFRLSFNVTASGSGGTAVTITNTGLPQVSGANRFVGDRGGVSVVPTFWRFLNSGGEAQVSAIVTASAPTTSLTGADLANGATYVLNAMYYTPDAF